MFDMDKLISAVVGLVFLAASVGTLPRVTLAILKAQAQLVQETKASKWGQFPLLPGPKARPSK
jgi:hypothetical protein